MLNFTSRVHSESLVKYGVRNLKFIFAPVYSCTHWLRPRNSPPPPHLGSYSRALLVSQDRRHLSVTPFSEHSRHVSPSPPCLLPSPNRIIGSMACQGELPACMISECLQIMPPCTQWSIGCHPSWQILPALSILSLCSQPKKIWQIEDIQLLYAVGSVTTWGF